jgi:dihydroorotate dehydrogenase electron transfer subunit
MTDTLTRHVEATLEAITDLGREHWLLELAVPGVLGPERFAPGQFVMLKGPFGEHPLLPRAFSLLEAAPGRLVILSRAVGRATRRLAALQPGARMHVLGPLGRGFPAPEAGFHDLLVGGGSGIPPLVQQAAAAVRAGLGDRVEVIYGGRTAGDLVVGDRLDALGIRWHACTEDGSRGTRGRVTDVLTGRLDGRDRRVMACGPLPMLRAVAGLCEGRGVTALVSLETEMACGLGICRGCMVPRPGGGYACTCTDGPVFDSREVAP